jgi:hypothetical protein
MIMNIKQDERFPDDKRPICPICDNLLTIHKLTGYRFTSYYWYCKCLIEIEYSEIVPDTEYNPEEDY